MGVFCSPLLKHIPKNGKNLKLLTFKYVNIENHMFNKHIEVTNYERDSSPWSKYPAD